MQIWLYTQLGLNILLFRVRIKSHLIYFHIHKGTEFHVKKHTLRRSLNSVNLGNCEGLQTKKFARLCVLHFTLFNHCWFIRMLGIFAKCPRKWPENDQKMLWHHQMTFISFICLQTFKVKLFSQKPLWSNILNWLQTKVIPKNPHSYIFQYDPKKWVLTNLFFLFWVSRWLKIV